MEKDTFNEEIMTIIYGSTIKANKRHIYLIDGLVSDPIYTAGLIGIIGIHDFIGFILMTAKHIEKLSVWLMFI